MSSRRLQRHQRYFFSVSIPLQRSPYLPTFNREVAKIVKIIDREFRSCLRYMRHDPVAWDRSSSGYWFGINIPHPRTPLCDCTYPSASLCRRLRRLCEVSCSSIAGIGTDTGILPPLAVPHPPGTPWHPGGGDTVAVVARLIRVCCHTAPRPLRREAVVDW